MRRNLLPVLVACAALLLIVSVGCTERVDRSSDGGSPTSYPKGTGEVVETAASARFSERIAEVSSDPRLISWTGVPIPFGLPPSMIAEALTPHEIVGNDTKAGPGPYCVEQGTLSTDQQIGKSYPDELFYPCAASYLAQYGVPTGALDLFIETSIAIDVILTESVALTVAWGMEWSTYGVNDDRPVFVFTPDGIMQPYYNLSWEPHLHAVIEATSSSIWKQIEDERLVVEGAEVDLGFYGTTDTDVGVLTPVGATYELPTETGLLVAHCCDYPYAVRLTYIFDSAGTPIDVRFDGFCWSEGWVMNDKTGDRAIDLPPRYDLPGCTLRSR